MSQGEGTPSNSSSSGQVRGPPPALVVPSFSARPGCPIGISVHCTSAFQVEKKWQQGARKDAASGIVMIQERQKKVGETGKTLLWSLKCGVGPKRDF